MYPYPMNTASLNFKQLPVSERIQLVEDIWDSIAQDASEPGVSLSAEHRAELRRRLAEHRADPSSAVPWEQVRAKLFKLHS
jgi:putative addiction module component (TIGR02574 family)